MFIAQSTPALLLPEMHHAKTYPKKRVVFHSAPIEGNRIAATCRMVGVNKVTVLRLLVEAGTLAKDFHNENSFFKL
jgi:hypothetical protein